MASSDNLYSGNNSYNKRSCGIQSIKESHNAVTERHVAHPIEKT